MFPEPNENPLDAMQFANAYEDGLKRQWSIGNPCTSSSVKEKPVFAITSRPSKKQYWRCGAGNFTPERKGNYCGIKRHSERYCNSKQKDHSSRKADSRQFEKRHLIDKRVQKVDYYEEHQNSEEDMMVLKVAGGGMSDTAS